MCLKMEQAFIPSILYHLLHASFMPGAVGVWCLSSKSTLLFPGCGHTSNALHYMACVPVTTLTAEPCTAEVTECDAKYWLSSILLDMRTGEEQSFLIKVCFESLLWRYASSARDRKGGWVSRPCLWWRDAGKTGMCPGTRIHGICDAWDAGGAVGDGGV